MSAWLIATKILFSFPLPRFGIITLLMSSYEVPKSLLPPSRMTKTKSINAFPFSSTSKSLSIIFLACLLSASLPSPSPGVSHNTRLSNSYFLISIVSGSTPTPTLATSVLNIALIVELLPQPVAPVIIMFIF